MNLIERFGYDTASKMSMSEVGLKKDMEKLQQDLLDYRRQHNIFEVGDLVIDTNYKDSDTQEIKSVNGNRIEVFHKNKAYYFATYIFSFRHATPEEIKAGKRL